MGRLYGLMVSVFGISVVALVVVSFLGNSAPQLETAASAGAANVSNAITGSMFTMTGWVVPVALLAMVMIASIGGLALLRGGKGQAR